MSTTENKSMSTPPRPVISVSLRPKLPVPTRPIKPYISLDDINTKDFYTKPYVFNHLRRAGLLNKRGEILTQAEYDSKQTDIAIGRENRRKIDDAIADLLCDIAKDHWEYSRKYVEKMGKQLSNQFQRILKQYSRRVQSIDIRYRSDENVQNELDNIRNKLATLETKSNKKLGINENDRNHSEITQILNEVRNQQIIIEQQQNRISNLEALSRNVSNGLTQDATDQAFQTSEKKTIDRESHGEKLDRNTDDKVNSMPIQSTQLSTGLQQSLNFVTQTDVHQLIQNEIRNYFAKQKDFTSKLTNRMNDLENQWKTFLQSNKTGVSSPNLLEPIDRSLLIQKPQKQANNNLEERSNKLERRLSIIPPPQDLSKIEQRLIQRENQPHTTNDPRLPPLQDQIKNILVNLQTLQQQIFESNGNVLERQEIEQRFINIDQSIKQLQNLYNEMTNLFATKADSQLLDQLIRNSEQTNKQIIELVQYVENDRGVLKSLEKRLSDLQRRLSQSSTTSAISNSTHKPVLPDYPVPDKPTPKELQAIMPYIELLPTFDMFNEHEWI